MRTVTLTVTLLWLYAAGAPCAEAQSSLSRRIRRSVVGRAIREDAARARAYSQQLDKTRERIAAERAQLAEARGDLAAAKAGLKQAAEDKRKAQEAAETRFAKELGLDRALAEERTARSAYETAAAPVIEELKQTAAYRQAEKLTEQARTELASLREDAALDEPSRREREARAAAELFAVEELTKQALERDETVRPLKQRSNEARREATRLRGEVARRVQKDAAVEAAERGIAEARRNVKTAESRVAALAARVEASETRLSQGIVDPKEAPRPKASKK